MMSSGPRILYVDDEEDIVSLAENFFADENIQIETSTSFHDALEKIKLNSYDLIISDDRMPAGSGQKLLEIIRQNGFTGKFILVTGNMLDSTLPLRYDHVIYKPLRFRELIDEVKKILSMKF